MKKCIACDIYLNTTNKTCPICHAVLKENDEVINYQAYPKHEFKRSISNITKFWILLSIIIVISSIVVNLLTLSKIVPVYWCIVVVASVFYVWSLIRYSIVGRGSLCVKMIHMSIFTAAVILLVEFFLVKSTSYFWSIDIVIPAILSFALIIITYIVLKHKRYFIDAIPSICLLIICNFIPYLIIKIAHLKSLSWPSIASISITCIMTLTIITFRLQELIQEFKKRFHF